MDGANISYRTMFGENWGFWLGPATSLERIDMPGRWEDLLFSFGRDSITATIREDMSYTLWFRDSGAQVLRRRVTGRRGTEPLMLEIRKWNPVKAQWSTYYRGTIDDTTIVVHADYTEASTKPVGVAQDLIDKADEEFTVTLAGKRIEIPRMWPGGTLGVTNTPGTYGYVDGHKFYGSNTAFEGHFYSMDYIKEIPKTQWLTYSGVINTSSVLSAQPYWSQSVLKPNLLIIARPGKYRITNHAQFTAQFWASLNSVSNPLQLIIGGVFYNNVPGAESNITSAGILSGYSARVSVNGEELESNQSKTYQLEKGDTIRIYSSPVINGGLILVYSVSDNIDLSKNSFHNPQFRLTFTGSVVIDPIQDIEMQPPISAPAVRDIDLFTQLCRQATRRANLAFDFNGYRPAYWSNPDGNEAAVFLLSLSRLRESVVEDGVSTMQGSDEAYFKGLTLRHFYEYFLAQGYKVSVETQTDRDGSIYPVVVVASYCNSQRSSRYFPEKPATIVDLGTAITDLELTRYEHTFTRVVAGSDPDDFGAYPREEGYQDPCNRRITYAIGAEDEGEPYTIEIPWPVTTFGLEASLQTFEGENDEARDRRWTEGEGIHLVCGSAGADGQIAAITQYDPIPGQFYRPLNMGFRPESLVRRNIPLLCMALAPYDMEDTFFEVVSVEGDTIDVKASGSSTGDLFLDDYDTDDPVNETYQNPNDPGGKNPCGILIPVMVTLRSTTDQNIYALLHEEATRYGVVRFRHRGREVAGYLRSVELNPTEHSVQKWELLPVWGQDLSFINS